MRTAIVAGGTGLVGSGVVSCLAGDPTWDRVVSLARRRVGWPGVEERLIDFERIEAAGPVDGDDVFCALGTTIKKAGSQRAFERVDLHYVDGVARAAYAAGASQFLLVSSIGADPGARNFYLSVKGRAEVAVRQVGFDCVQIFRPSLLLGDRPDRRFLEQVSGLATRLARPLMAGRWERYRPIPAEAVAAAMVVAARRPRRGVHIHTHREMRALASEM